VHRFLLHVKVGGDDEKIATEALEFRKRLWINISADVDCILFNGCERVDHDIFYGKPVSVHVD
jgi:hypothetical protein